MPLSRSSGLTTSASSMSSIACACRVAATRPAKPRPRGTRTPWYTSSSIPRAAVATSCLVGVVEEEDGRGVRRQDLADAIQELDEEFLQGQLREAGIGHRLDVPQPLGDRPGPTLG